MVSMFKHLSGHHNIIVTGPQRSGTRICAQMIAHDTGHKYVDEIAFGHEAHTPDGTDALIRELESPLQVVIHAPAIFHVVAHFARRRAIVVVMKRDVDDILASQKRINWQHEEHERAKYPNSKGLALPLAKYNFWDSQKGFVSSWVEVDYASLAGHPLFIPKDRRLKFEWNQTEE